MAIAAYVTELLAGTGLDLGAPAELPPLTMPHLGEAFPRPYLRAELIAADPAYGTLVCHCERVSAGEIRDALTSTIPPAVAGRAAAPDPGRAADAARGSTAGPRSVP